MRRAQDFQKKRETCATSMPAWKLRDPSAKFAFSMDLSKLGLPSRGWSVHDHREWLEVQSRYLLSTHFRKIAGVPHKPYVNVETLEITSSRSECLKLRSVAGSEVTWALGRIAFSALATITASTKTLKVGRQRFRETLKSYGCVLLKGVLANHGLLKARIALTWIRQGLELSSKDILHSLRCDKRLYLDAVATDAHFRPRTDIWGAIQPLRFIGRAKGIQPLPIVHDDQGIPAASLEERGELWFQHHAALELGIPTEVEVFTHSVDKRQRTRILPSCVPASTLIPLCDLELAASQVKSGAHWRFDAARLSSDPCFR